MNPIWAIFWLIIFFFISFVVAGFSAFCYVFLYVLVVCIPGLSGVTDILLQGIQFPHFCAKAMMEGKPLC
ncbi:uncharacterized protein LOC129915638 isoform X2 [Episyrphus balteatus]|uniref:uncharacterized protein LOC129915638 isoform X2 n=1 Tax=Episyrphus balteatus TaxID=286459 RepID=UPI0024867F88|nr:uncharacterized protein LOC129915638 isoform X2 [Episyrphus balteatus]XP_055851248.1 uncharacterized protein LOC129915638 isoform X2 [Episyrphus balteatus]XP_055851249.1 uncharacterized protein LOC129915638 isoform X2 [Episyrphus balteatus]XP_055851250.1 uncharacterized protein LOC129915638 isoform X2 [Episyrphus balteatus]